jgi:DNA-binding LytR/AlgR family response regulator
MQVKVEIDDRCGEPEVIIKTNRITDEINEIVQKLSTSQQKLIAGFNDDTVKLLDAADIIRLYTANQRVYAQTKSDEFTVHLRLYELEERLDKTLFVRISNSDIVNLKAIKKIDLSFAGTICIILSNDTITYVSRRYVAKIKQALGI